MASRHIRHSALVRLGKRKGIDIGMYSYKGWSLWYSDKDSFVIEHRGPPFGPQRMEFHFAPSAKKYSTLGRGTALRLAFDVMGRLTRDVKARVLPS